jgi:L-2-hydroxyglutarate oxidase LhgO
MKEYCRAKSIPMNEHGKVIVAKRESELPALRELRHPVETNGADAVQLGRRELKEIEPSATTAGQALYVKSTAVGNPQHMMEPPAAMPLRKRWNFASVAGGWDRQARLTQGPHRARWPTGIL